MSSFKQLDMHPIFEFDCAVRAFSVAFDVSYEDAEKFLEKYGYTPENGLPTKQVRKLFAQISRTGAFNLLARDVTYMPGFRPSLEDFIYAHPVGVFLISLSGHLTAVRNGTCYDTVFFRNRKVFSYLRVRSPQNL